MKSSKSIRTTSTKKADLPRVLLPTCGLGGAFPDFPAGKTWCPRVLSVEGVRGAAIFWFPQLLRDLDAILAVASPACLAMEASVVGWPGMGAIWRKASVTPLGKERLVKPGPPSKPWPRRTQASPTAWPSPAGPHPVPSTGGSPRAGPPGSMVVPTGHHGP
jgi:hypothetical protein